MGDRAHGRVFTLEDVKRVYLLARAKRAPKTAAGVIRNIERSEHQLAIPPEEPTVVLRASDTAARVGLSHYLRAAQAINAPPDVLKRIEGSLRDFDKWKAKHPTRPPR